MTKVPNFSEERAKKMEKQSQSQTGKLEIS